jgi:hypothetical protein
VKPASFLIHFSAWAAAILATTAAAPLARAEPGDDLRVSVLTFGPGDHPFFKFGHNAIMVEQRPRGESAWTPEPGPGWVYNFGTFAFDSPALIPKFLRGRFKYWLSVSSVEDTLQSYAAANRSILAQELDLGAGQKWALAQALRENARPENREYLYDYFRDNCSTRVRDAVDRVVEGRVRQAGQVAGSGTFRSHALRMVADLWPEYVGIYLGLGRAADLPIQRWDEAFLPERLAALLRTVRLPDAAGERPLVKSEKILYRARRPEKPAAPPRWGAYFLALGLFLGIVLVGLGRLASRFAPARVVFGISVAGLGGGLGLVGLIMLALWIFTDHKIAYANANILQFAPWAVVLFGYGIGLALGRPRSTGRARAVVLSVVGCSLAGIVCKVVPGANQDNWPFILFGLPTWLGMLGGLAYLRRALQ